MTISMICTLHICQIEYGSESECVTVQIGFDRENGMTDCKSGKLKQCHRYCTLEVCLLMMEKCLNNFFWYYREILYVEYSVNGLLKKCVYSTLRSRVSDWGPNTKMTLLEKKYVDVVRSYRENEWG